MTIRDPFANRTKAAGVDELTITAATLIVDMSRLAGTACPACGRSLCGHQLLMSIAAGFKHAPRCRACLARALDRDPEDFRGRVVTYIRHRDCYLGAWQWTTAREGNCADGGEIPEVHLEDAVDSVAHDTLPGLLPDVEWDAGDMACGDLVLELRTRLLMLAPGRLLRVVARDPGAPQDLPAWCGMTGHRLVTAHHPDYFIARRRN